MSSRRALAACLTVLAAAMVVHPREARGQGTGNLLAFVSNEASHDVTVVDLDARHVVATIPVGGRARGIQAAPGGRLVYVAVSDDSPTVESSADAIVAIDVATLRVVTRIESGTDP